MTQCFRCGRPVHVERLEPNRTFTTDPDGTPHTCHESAARDALRNPKPKETP